MKKFFLITSIAFFLGLAQLVSAQGVCVYAPSTGQCSPVGCDPRCIAGSGAGTAAGSQSSAQGQNLTYSPLEPIPGITTGANGGQLDFPSLLGNIYKIAIIIGALFSVLMLTLSGIRYMLSDVVTSKEKALQRIKACLYGLVLIAASWLILNTINPQLTTFTLNPGTAMVNTPIQSVKTNTPTAQQLEEARRYQASVESLNSPLNSTAGGVQPVSP